MRTVFVIKSSVFTRAWPHPEKNRFASSTRASFLKTSDVLCVMNTVHGNTNFSRPRLPADDAFRENTRAQIALNALVNHPQAGRVRNKTACSLNVLFKPLTTWVDSFNLIPSEVTGVMVLQCCYLQEAVTKESLSS